MRRHAERGTAMIYAALLVVAFAALGSAHVARARALALSHARDRADLHLDAALAGGADRARWSLARDEAYAGESLSIGPCDVTVTVTADGVRVTAETGAAPFTQTLVRHADVAIGRRADGSLYVGGWSESR